MVYFFVYLLSLMSFLEHAGNIQYERAAKTFYITFPFVFHGTRESHTGLDQHDDSFLAELSF